MMQGYKRVGVLLGEKDEGKLRNLEKWPLIKAYALDGNLKVFKFSYWSWFF